MKRTNLARAQPPLQEVLHSRLGEVIIVPVENVPLHGRPICLSGHCPSQASGPTEDLNEHRDYQRMRDGLILPRSTQFSCAGQCWAYCFPEGSNWLSNTLWQSPALYYRRVEAVLYRPPRSLFSSRRAFGAKASFAPAWSGRQRRMSPSFWENPFTSGCCRFWLSLSDWLSL